MSYKLVPLEPTPEMEAAYKNGDGSESLHVIGDHDYLVA